MKKRVIYYPEVVLREEKLKQGLKDIEASVVLNVKVDLETGYSREEQIVLDMAQRYLKSHSVVSHTRHARLIPLYPHIVQVYLPLYGLFLVNDHWDYTGIEFRDEKGRVRTPANLRVHYSILGENHMRPWWEKREYKTWQERFKEVLERYKDDPIGTALLEYSIGTYMGDRRKEEKEVEPFFDHLLFKISYYLHRWDVYKWEEWRQEPLKREVEELKNIKPTTLREQLIKETAFLLDALFDGPFGPLRALFSEK